jgi:hypothetical protein
MLWLGVAVVAVKPDYEFGYRKGIEMHYTSMYDLLSQSSIRNSYPMATHNSFMYKRLGRGDQGNVKNETSVSNGN